MMSVLRSSHVRGVSLVVLLAVMAVTIVDFEWKIAAADYFARDELSLTKYFGGVYACVALSTGLVQFVATRKLLTKKRFATAVQTYPVVLFATVGAAIYYSSGLGFFIAMTLAKGGDTFRRAIHDPSLQILYAPLSVRFRRQSIAFISGIVKPLAEAVSATIIVLGVHVWGRRPFVFFVLAIVLVWLVANQTVLRGYEQAKEERGDV